MQKKRDYDKEKFYDLTKTLLSLLSALLSAAVLFLASRSGARSRGNLDAVFGLRLPDRDELWLSFSTPLVLRSEVSVGRGRAAAEVLLESAAACAGDFSPSGVGGLVMPTDAAAPLMAGSCGPGSGPDEAGAGGGGG